MTILLSSCMIDPCYKGKVPCLPEDVWDGPNIPPSAFANLGLAGDDLPLCGRILSISDIVDIALRNNPLTEESWATARAAAFNWEASKSTLYPTIQAQETLQFQKSHFGSVSNSSLNNNTTTPSGTVTPISSLTGTSGGSSIQGYQKEVLHNISANYLLFDFGGRDATIDSAKNALFASNWTHNRTLQNVVIGALRAYYNLINAKAQLEASKANLKDAQKNYDAAEAQFNAGVGNLVDYLQAKSTLLNAILAVEQNTGLEQTAYGVLANAMGLPANTHLDVENLPEDLPLDQVTEGVDQLVEEAKMQRPDLASAYATYVQKKADLDVARSNGWPTLSADFNWQRNVFITSPANNNHFYSGALVLQVPIFSGFLYQNLERKAAYDAETAYAAMLNIESTVYLDVVTDYYAYKTAVQTVKSSIEFLKYAQEAYNAAYANYTQGTGSLLDVLVAFSTLANARSQAIQARTLWVTSLANLSYATGML